MGYSSKLLEQAVDQVSMLPGIGKRSALRLVLYLLKQPENRTLGLANALLEFRTKLSFCQICHNISDDKICEICSSSNRDESLICVVEDVRDVMAIEATAQFKGRYHVLGGLISPLEGVGPQDLNINQLVDRVDGDQVKEVIFALSSTVEGDTTNFYIFKKLDGKDVKLTTIAKGISVGNELEYTDEVTLGRSIMQRVPLESSFKANS